MEKPHKTYSLINEDEPENKRFFSSADFENEGARIIISLESYYTEIPATKAILDPRRKVNTYSLRKLSHEESGLLIKNLTTDGTSGFSIEIVFQKGLKCSKRSPKSMYKNVTSAFTDS